MRNTHVWIRIGIVFGLLLGLVPASLASAQTGTTVTISPANTTITPGQVVSVSVLINNVTNLGGAEVHLAFNPNVLEVVDADPAQAGVQITNGGFLSPDFTAVNSADNALGTIDYSVSQINRPGVNGSGTLATIAFKGKAPGTAPVTFRQIQAAPNGVLLANSSGAAIPATTQSGQVVVSGPTPTPGPTTTPGPTPTPVPGGILGYHQVLAGQTLYCIGRGWKVQPYAIASTNRLYSPYYVYPGQILTIPNAPWTNIPAGTVCPPNPVGGPGPTPPIVTPGPTPPPAYCRTYYTVKPGDTLWGISRYFGVDMYYLAQVNKIYNVNLIYAGQVLCIP